jgi:hypothetical protein
MGVRAGGSEREEQTIAHGVALPLVIWNIEWTPPFTISKVAWEDMGVAILNCLEFCRRTRIYVCGYDSSSWFQRTPQPRWNSWVRSSDINKWMNWAVCFIGWQERDLHTSDEGLWMRNRNRSPNDKIVVDVDVRKLLGHALWLFNWESCSRTKNELVFFILNSRNVLLKCSISICLKCWKSSNSINFHSLIFENERGKSGRCLSVSGSTTEKSHNHHQHIFI